MKAFETAPWIAMEPDSEVARMPEIVNEKGYIKNSEGIRIYFEDVGPLNERPPLVFLYGLVCSKEHWTHQLNYFKPNYRTIWSDYRGHHNSDFPNDAKSIVRRQFVEDILTVLDHRKIDRAVLLGHSLGVQVALEFFKQYPDRVQALILANGTAGNACESILNTNITDMILDPTIKVGNLFPNAFEWAYDKLGHHPLLTPLTEKLLLLTGFHPTLIDPKEVKNYAKVAASFSWDILSRLLSDMRSFDGLSWIHEIHVPTLILGGKQDLIVPPKNQEIMHQLIPNSRLVLVPSGSHCPQMDRPGYVNQAIAEFLEELS